ncbi:MAG: outer membrane protein assembly factor BamD [Bacteroidia bacterium]
MKMTLQKSLLISLVALSLAVFTSCHNEFARVKRSNDYAYKLEMAIHYYDKGEYTKAQILFEELQNVYKGTDKAETVYFYNAYTNFEMGDYLLAGFLFRNYVRTFPTGKRAEECAYMTAYCYYLNSPEYALDQTDTYAAIREFAFFLKQYPKSERIPDCNEYVDKLRAKLEMKSYSTCVQYFHLTDYKAAIADIGIHNKEFPASKHKEELVFLVLKSYYELGLLSVDEKKAERMKLAMDNYIKFVDTYPKSIYLAEAQSIFDSATKIKAVLDKEAAQRKADKELADKKAANKP